MHIIAYTYEADTHCPGCTAERHKAGGFECTPASPVDDVSAADECGIPYCAKDRKGNCIHPVFSTDELPDGGSIWCTDCLGVIAEA